MPVGSALIGAANWAEQRPKSCRFLIRRQRRWIETHQRPSLDRLSVDCRSLHGLDLDPQEANSYVVAVGCRPPWTEPILERGAEEGAVSARWLGRGLTAGLWIALVAVAGPLAWKGGLVIAVGMGLQSQRRRHASPPTTRSTPALQSASLPIPVSRQELATSFRLNEHVLFRVRHARICEVSHDANGLITAIRTNPQALEVPELIQHANPFS